MEWIARDWRGARLLCSRCCSCPRGAGRPADVNAAARGVVRVVIVEIDGDEVIPVSHGTGFAVGPRRSSPTPTSSPKRAPTTSWRSASSRRTARRGLRPAGRGQPARRPRADRTTSPMRLPPLTIAGNATADSGSVTAVGYPMNVDRAQGLSTRDIFRRSRR
jgi:hypothetical protein